MWYKKKLADPGWDLKLDYGVPSLELERAALKANLELEKAAFKFENIRYEPKVDIQWDSKWLLSSVVGDDYSPAKEKENKIITDACVNLWRSAVNDLEFQYPDPRVSMTPFVSAWAASDHQVFISLMFYYLRDTSNPDRYISKSNGFRHFGRPTGWPGYECAYIYLTGLWTLFNIHESLESVTKKGQTGRHYWSNTNQEGYDSKLAVVDAHDPDGMSQKQLQNTRDIQAVMAVGVGDRSARLLLADNRVRAIIELENEVKFLKGTQGRWE